MEIKSYGKEKRAYGEESQLIELGRRLQLKFFPAYRQFVTWERIFDQRLQGMYRFGLEVVRQREEEKIGVHERPAGKVLGAIMMAVAIGIYFMMFWYFPLRWKLSLLLYVVASVLMFSSLCIFYEDYEWASKIVDIFCR